MDYLCAFEGHQEVLDAVAKGPWEQLSSRARKHLAAIKKVAFNILYLNHIDLDKFKFKVKEEGSRFKVSILREDDEFVQLDVDGTEHEEKPPIVIWEQDLDQSEEGAVREFTPLSLKKDEWKVTKVEGKLTEAYEGCCPFNLDGRFLYVVDLITYYFEKYVLCRDNLKEPIYSSGALEKREREFHVEENGAVTRAAIKKLFDTIFKEAGISCDQVEDTKREEQENCLFMNIVGIVNLRLGVSVEKKDGKFNAVLLTGHSGLTKEDSTFLFTDRYF